MHENNSAEVTSTSKLHKMNENAHQFCISNFSTEKKTFSMLLLDYRVHSHRLILNETNYS